MSADLELENAIRARILASAAVLTLVPGARILYRQDSKPRSPSITQGDSQVIPMGQDSLGRSRNEVFQTLHIWKEELTLHGVKEIMGAIADALRLPRLPAGPNWAIADVQVSSMRALRDPDGKTAHGILSVVAMLSRLGP